MKPILDISPAEGLDNFALLCDKLPDVDMASIRRIALRTIKYLQANKAQRARMALDQSLEQRWYAALDRGVIDWAVYDTDQYLAELWACWVVYSREYLRSIQKPGSMESGSVVDSFGPVHSVVDLGCGFGYTSAVWKSIYPDAQVVGTNLDDTKQIVLARIVAQKYGFQIATDIHYIDHLADVVFASEYFEHIPAPVDHLKEVISLLRPRALLIANAFNARAIGHFNRYLVDGAEMNGKDTSARFDETLRKAGYGRVKTKLWNNRPAYWRRD